MEYRVRFIFEGMADDRMPSLVKNYFIKEFVDRRDVFINKVNPRYEKWNTEFNSLYPDRTGEDKEYTEFISKKHEIYLKEANETRIFMNKVILIDEDNDIVGYIPELKTKILLRLI